MGVNSLLKTVTRQRRDCDLNPGPTAPESSTLTTRLPSHPDTSTRVVFRLGTKMHDFSQKLLLSMHHHRRFVDLWSFPYITFAILVTLMFIVFIALLRPYTNMFIIK